MRFSSLSPPLRYYCPKRPRILWRSQTIRASWRCARTSAGAFSGRALLIFPEANSLELVRTIVGRELPLEDIVDLEDEALAETGNIILNSWVATIANLLKRGLKMSLPVVVRGDSRRILESIETEQRLILFLHIRFEISKKEIGGYVALLMEIPSIDELRSLIADFVASVAGSPGAAC
jgi:chemotaxis protein CheC